jgi:hypothetical protein
MVDLKKSEEKRRRPSQDFTLATKKSWAARRLNLSKKVIKKAKSGSDH